MRRLFLFLLIILTVALPVSGKEPIKWVDFQVPYESLKLAMAVDIETFEQEKHIDWVDILALAGCRTGGKCGLDAVKKAVQDLKGNSSPEELLMTITAMPMRRSWGDFWEAMPSKRMVCGIRPMG